MGNEVVARSCPLPVSRGKDALLRSPPSRVGKGEAVAEGGLGQKGNASNEEIRTINDKALKRTFDEPASDHS